MEDIILTIIILIFVISSLSSANKKAKRGGQRVPSAAQRAQSAAQRAQSAAQRRTYPAPQPFPAAPVTHTAAAPVAPAFPAAPAAAASAVPAAPAPTAIPMKPEPEELCEDDWGSLEHTSHEGEEFHIDDAHSASDTPLSARPILSDSEPAPSLFGRELTAEELRRAVVMNEVLGSRGGKCAWTKQ